MCQVFCSALPVAYAKSTRSQDWDPWLQDLLTCPTKMRVHVARYASHMEERVSISSGPLRCWILHVIVAQAQSNAYNIPHQQLDEGVDGSRDRTCSALTAENAQSTAMQDNYTQNQPKKHRAENAVDAGKQNGMHFTPLF